jgi:hypothetical protein
VKEDICRRMPRKFFSSSQFQRKRKSLVFFQSINFLWLWGTTNTSLLWIWKDCPFAFYSDRVGISSTFPLNKVFNSI